MNRDKVTVAQIEVCETAKKMYHSGLVAGTWGNISARVDDEYMVITPSGMDYDRLCPEDMVLVNMNTLEYEGRLKPSVETPIHAAIFKDRPEMNGIVHTHSNYALVMATARKPIPPICDDQVQILGGDVRVADYIYGPNSGRIISGTITGGMPETRGRAFTNREELVAALKRTAKPGDVLLFKASRGIHLEQVLDEFLGEEK